MRPYRRPANRCWVLPLDGTTVVVTVNLEQLEECWNLMNIRPFPRLRWTKHPYYRVANSYDPDRHLLSFDAEGYVASMFRQTGGNLEMSRRLLVRSFAHESRHAWQRLTFGRWFMFHDHLTFAQLIATLFIWAIGAIAFIGLQALFQGKTLLMFSSVYAIGLLGAIAFRVTRVGARKLFKKYSYRRNWIERDAEKFARQSLYDSNWQRVITLTQVR